MEYRWNERARETGDPRENRPTSALVWHDSHIQKYEGDPSGETIQLACKSFRDKQVGLAMSLKCLPANHKRPVMNNLMFIGPVRYDSVPSQRHVISHQMITACEHAVQGRTEERTVYFASIVMVVWTMARPRCYIRSSDLQTFVYGHVATSRSRGHFRLLAALEPLLSSNEFTTFPGLYPLPHWPPGRTCYFNNQSWGRGGVVIRVLRPPPPPQASRAGLPVRSLPSFRMCESCRTIPLFCGFSRRSPVSPAYAFRRCSTLTSLHSIIVTSMLRAAEISSLVFDHVTSRVVMFVVALNASKQTRPGRPSAPIILRLETQQTRPLSSRHCARKTSRDGGVPSADMRLVFSLRHHGQDSPDCRTDAAMRPMATLILHKTEKCMTCIQVALEKGFQKCSFYRGQSVPKKTHRPATSPGTIPSFENLAVTRPGFETDSAWWEASSLTSQSLRPLCRMWCEPIGRSSGVGWPTCNRRGAGSRPGASDVADAQFDSRTGNSSTSNTRLHWQMTEPIINVAECSRHVRRSHRTNRTKLLHTSECDSISIETAPLEANRVRSIPGRVTPDFRKWESCQTMPFVGEFSRGSSRFPTLSFWRCSILPPHITLIGSEDLSVESRPNLFTPSLHLNHLASDVVIVDTHVGTYVRGRSESADLSIADQLLWTRHYAECARMQCANLWMALPRLQTCDVAGHSMATLAGWSLPAGVVDHNPAVSSETGDGAASLESEQSRRHGLRETGSSLERKVFPQKTLFLEGRCGQTFGLGGEKLTPLTDPIIRHCTINTSSYRYLLHLWWLSPRIPRARALVYHKANVQQPSHEREEIIIDVEITSNMEHGRSGARKEIQQVKKWKSSEEGTTQKTRHGFNVLYTCPTVFFPYWLPCMYEATTPFHWANEDSDTIKHNVRDWSADNLADRSFGMYVQSKFQGSRPVIHKGAAVAERLACSPTTLATGFNPRPDYSGFSHVRIAPDDAACRRVLSVFSRFPHHYIPALQDVYVKSIFIHSPVSDITSPAHLVDVSFLSRVLPEKYYVLLREVVTSRKGEDPTQRTGTWTHVAFISPASSAEGKSFYGAAVAERLGRSPPTKANRVQSPAGSPDIRKWESCRTMPLVGGFSRGSPVSHVPSFLRRSIFTSFTLIGSQDLAVKSRRIFFTHFTHPNLLVHVLHVATQ
ncbi:hypothetical protein PR048_033700, partial [Dryococelus australis]